MRLKRTVLVVSIVIGAIGLSAVAADGFKTDASSEASASEAVVPMSTPLVYVSNAFAFPDALAGGPAAALNKGPILLVNQNEIPSATADELTRLNPDRIVILGGPLAVSGSVESALGAYTSGPVERLSGTSRFETAAEISKANFPAPQVTVLVDSVSTTTEISATCTEYENVLLTIDTSVAGTLVINGRVTIRLDHVNGTASSVNFGISQAADSCVFNYAFDGFIYKQAPTDSGLYFETVPLMRVVDLGPGVHNFYVTGYLQSGAGSADFWLAGLNATFHPSP